MKHVPTHPCICGQISWAGGETSGDWTCGHCGEVCPCYPTGVPSLQWLARVEEAKVTETGQADTSHGTFGHEDTVGATVDLEYVERQLLDALKQPGFGPIASNALVAIRFLRVRAAERQSHRIRMSLPPGCTGPHDYGDGLFYIKDATGADYIWGATHVAAIRSAWAQFGRTHGATVYKRSPWPAVQEES